MSDPWRQYETVQFRVPSSIQRGELKLAGFDLEGTLIWGDKGQTFCRTENDWIWSCPDVPLNLKRLSEEGYTVAIFTTWKSDNPRELEQVRKRIDKILSSGGIEAWVFLATANDKYRKPHPGMFQLLLGCLGGASFSSESFYSGDAIGFKINESSWAPWYLWSNVDYQMARDLNLRFLPPNEIFGELPSPQIGKECRLIITCGQENSGWNLLYESLRQPVSIGDERYLQAISVMELRSYRWDSQVILVVCGSFPQLEQRKMIASQLRCSEYTVFWYSRPSTKRLERNIEEEFCRTFQHPKETGEVWVRIN